MVTVIVMGVLTGVGGLAMMVEPEVLAQSGSPANSKVTPLLERVVGFYGLVEAKQM